MQKKTQAAKKESWVLVVEDDVFINKAYAAKFAHENILVKMADDGEKALEILKDDDKPSIILLDLMLPKKSGFEVLEEIKKDQKNKDIPVLILTNLAQGLDANRGIALGAKEYLVKADLKIEEIIQKVKQYLAVAK